MPCSALRQTARRSDQEPSVRLARHGHPAGSAANARQLEPS